MTKNRPAKRHGRLSQGRQDQKPRYQGIPQPSLLSLIEASDHRDVAPLVCVKPWALEDSHLDPNKKNGADLKDQRETRPYDKHGKQHSSHLSAKEHRGRRQVRRPAGAHSTTPL